MKAYIHVHCTRLDGTLDSLTTLCVDCKETPMPFQRKKATPYMVKLSGRWRRVYARVINDWSIHYIGKKPTHFLVTLETP